MLIIFNLHGLLVTAISGALTVLLFLAFDHKDPSLLYFFYTVPLTCFGYLAELLDFRPRLYGIPLKAIGAFATVYGVFHFWGPIPFAEALLAFIFLSIAFKVFQEKQRWTAAQKALKEYELAGSETPELHELMLTNAIFQNIWTKANSAYIEHNKKVLQYLLTDTAIQLTARELELINFTQSCLNSGQDLLKWGWRLKYISEMQSRLLKLRDSRSIGRFRAE